jgi:hypothetical protein
MDFRFIVIALAYLIVILFVHLYLKNNIVHEKFTQRNPETSDRIYSYRTSEDPLVVKTQNTFDKGSIETSLDAHLKQEEKNKENEGFQNFKHVVIPQKETADEWSQYFKNLQTEEYTFEEVPTINQLQKQQGSQLIPETDILNPTGPKQDIAAFDEFELSPYKSFLEFSGEGSSVNA